jgi:hypothetical protein
VSRKQAYEEKFWNSAVEKKILLNNNKTELKVKMVLSEDESFLLCRSPQKEAKETSIFTRKQQKFESEIERIRTGLKKKGCRKGYEYINQRIGRLKEKYGIGHLYEIRIEHEKEIISAVEYERNGNFDEKSGRVGEYVIRTNHLQWSEEQISKVHRMLSTVEDSFRSIKSDLGLRPNFHKNDINCQAHIFIGVLAYHIMIAILKRLEIKGIRYRWESIRNILSTHVRVSTVFNTETEDSVHIRTTAQPNRSQSEIYNALGVRHRPLKTIKLKISSRQKKCSDEKNG